MARYNLALMGFGNVGQAFARLLIKKTPELRERYGIEWQLTGVNTRRYGWLANREGLNVEELLAGAAQPKIQISAGRFENPQAALRDWLAAAAPDVLFEVTALNPLTGQPAIGHLRAGLEYGAHVVTANKGPVVHAYKALRDLAAARGRRFMFESTVMDGAPIFSLFRETLPAANLLRFRGILNSTTNFILTEMEAGRSFEEAVKQAQAIGIAETDTSADIDGWDAAVKVAALVTVLMDLPLKPADIQREGIRPLTGEQVRAARLEGKPYKLVCCAEREGDQVRASIRPEQVPLSDPLSAVSGTSSLVHFETDMLTGLTITEHDPSPETTAYGMLADFINAVK
jgi:homoserine dehydrogenase